jgi:hypothetical protein
MNKKLFFITIIVLSILLAACSALDSETVSQEQFRKLQQTMEAQATQLASMMPTQPSSQQPAEPAAAPAGVAPTEAFCQLGVTKMTPGVPTQSLSWDAVQRGYMDDSLSTAIWTTTAYCRTVFPQQVTLLFDSIAANPVRVDGRVVAAGNGRIETGRVFEWVYPIPSRSNGHAYIVQP